MKALLSMTTLILVSAWMCTAPVRADTAYLGVLSIEWLVDSADDVYLVSTTGKTETVNEDETPWLSFKLCEILKSGSGERTLPPENRWRWFKGGATAGDELLLFGRTVQESGNKHVEIAHAVNLSRRLPYGADVAVTKRGKLLAEKEAILKYVRKRIRLDRRLPAGCGRSYVDKLVDRSFRSVSMAHIGAFELDLGSTEIDDGDAVFYLVVPADPDLHKLLLRHARGERFPRAPIRALVNYPGKRTTRALARLLETEDASRREEALAILKELHERRIAHDNTRQLERLGRASQAHVLLTQAKMILATPIVHTDVASFLEASPEQAIDYCTEALRLTPNSKEALLLRASAYDRLGKTDLAKKDRAAAGVE